MTKRPSFLKRQKEQQRKAKAQQKRDSRRARRDAPPEEQDPNFEAEVSSLADERPDDIEVPDAT